MTPNNSTHSLEGAGGREPPYYGYHKGQIIRERTRRSASPKEGLRQAWTEIQVVAKRRVLARFDTVQQAIKWIDREEAEGRL